MMRVGHGFDAHRLIEGRRLVLGGITVPHDRGALGHSDADVLAHALSDALLGAAAMGDLGGHFPDSDPQWRGADSSRFVTATLQLLERRGLRVMNADLTLLAQAPRIAPWREEIRRSVALKLGLRESQVNLKATTTEQLGFLGRGEGLAAMATVLIDDAPAATA